MRAQCSEKSLRRHREHGDLPRVNHEDTKAQRKFKQMLAILNIEIVSSQYSGALDSVDLSLGS